MWYITRHETANLHIPYFIAFSIIKLPLGVKSNFILSQLASDREGIEWSALCPYIYEIIIHL